MSIYNNNKYPVVDLAGLTALFNDVFGVAANTFQPSTFSLKVNALEGDTAARDEYGLYGSPYYANDANGREYFMPVQVIYTNSSGQATTINLPYPVISIKAHKHVVDTEMTEVAGMVSELVNISAYKISIKGFVFDPDDNFPEADMQVLRNLYECNVPISISNPLTDIWLLRPNRIGSNQVTIRDMEMPYEIGVKSVRAYTIEMVSESPFNLNEI